MNKYEYRYVKFTIHTYYLHTLCNTLSMLSLFRKGFKKKKQGRPLSPRPPRPPSKIGNLFVIFFNNQGSNLRCLLMQFTTFGTREKRVFIFILDIFQRIVGYLRVIIRRRLRIRKLPFIPNPKTIAMGAPELVIRGPCWPPENVFFYFGF